MVCINRPLFANTALSDYLQSFSNEKNCAKLSCMTKGRRGKKAKTFELGSCYGTMKANIRL